MSTTVTPERDPVPEPPTPLYRRRWFLITTVSIVVLIGAAIGGIWWYLRDDSPSPVDQEAAVAELVAVDSTIAEEAAEEADEEAAATPATGAATAETTPAADGTPAGTAAATEMPNAVSGTWTVDTSIGEFNFDDSTGTFVGFRVDEELSGIGAATAVGRTPTVTGSITFDGTTLAAATIEADMTSIVTDDRRRDDRVQDALETDTFPTATFTLTQPLELGDAVVTGAAVAVQAPGALTIHGVTTPVTLPLEAQLVGDTIVVTGSLETTLSTYGVEAPSAPIVVSVSDDVTIELKLYFSPA